MKSFQEIGLNENLLRATENLGFNEPMPIQQEVLPLLLQDKCQDIIALAQTGTGKTAAFGFPIIQKTDTAKKEIQYLIISPTRELCLQIADDLRDYSAFSKNIKIAAIFGGSSMERQESRIKNGAQIISATPGRLVDFLNRGKIDISKVKAVVLDEADEMLNMGFKDELEAILKATPKNRNTFMFSATMPKQLVAIANNYMKNPIEITIGIRNAGAENVEHFCYYVHEKDRYFALKRIVDFYPQIYGIIFCRTRSETKDIALKLQQDGYNSEALHGDLTQSQREQVMTKFRIRHLKLLVATDVAARGLDVENLTHIINYNLPEELEIYTHRSGRTGRAGKTGISIALVNLREKQKIKLIEKQLNKKFTVNEIPKGREICEKQLFYLIDKVEKIDVDYSQVESYLPTIYRKLEWMDRTELIQKFVSVEFNRFLDYYKNLPDLSTPTENKRDRKTKSPDFNYTRFFINLGKTDELKPGTLMGMLNDFTGIGDIEIGEIEILKNFSFFEADEKFKEQILKAFKGKKLKNREIKVEVAEKTKRGAKQRSINNKKRLNYYKESRRKFENTRPFHERKSEDIKFSKSKKRDRKKNIKSSSN